MSTPVYHLLDLFDALPDPDKRSAVAEILRRVAGEGDTPANALDIEYHAECEADAVPGVSLAEVRAALAVIPGDLTADFTAEREER